MSTGSSRYLGHRLYGRLQRVDTVFLPVSKTVVVKFGEPPGKGPALATPRRMRERTVAFFEVVASESGTHRRLEQLPWAEFLASVATTPLERRTVEVESTLVGNVVTYQEEDHLLLHRAKDAGEWLSILNWHTGEWKQLEARAAEGFLETSVICFLPYGNVIGIMRGSTSAPTNKSLEVWLNELKPFTGTSLIVRPLMSHSEVERLRTAEGASRVEIRIGSSKLSALRQRTGRLARILRIAGEEYGDIEVTMTITVPRGKTRFEDRQALLHDLQDLGEVMPEAADRARATLVYAEQSGPEYSQLAEFVEHHITAKRRVPAVDDRGEAIRISSAVRVVLDAAAEHEDELRLATDTP